MNSFNNQPKSSMRRASSLDALRGYAILTMVLSATVVYGILPAWMYHMQEPPPAHVFQPELSGLTWVDLVFPFFFSPWERHSLSPYANALKREKAVGSWFMKP